MKTTYSITEVRNHEIQSTYFWIKQTIERKVLGIPIHATKVLGSSIDPHCGKIPFFNKRKAEQRIEELVKAKQHER